MKELGLILLLCLLFAGCSKTPGDMYVGEQSKAAKAGNHWGEYKLWQAYYSGTHGVDKNRAKADKWLRQFVKDISVVRFEAANGFSPKNAADYLKSFAKRHAPLNSDQDRIGIAGFLRTKKEGDKLVGSFLTNEPDKLQAYIENNPELKFASSEVMTPEMFVEYERSIQESL